MHAIFERLSQPENTPAVIVAVICIFLVLILLLVLFIRAAVRRIRPKRRYGRSNLHYRKRTMRRKRVSRRKYGKFEYHGYTGSKKNDKK